MHKVHFFRWNHIPYALGKSQVGTLTDLTIGNLLQALRTNHVFRRPYTIYLIRTYVPWLLSHYIMHPKVNLRRSVKEMTGAKGTGHFFYRRLFRNFIKMRIVKNPFLCRRVFHNFILLKPQCNFSLCFFWNI